MKKIVIRTIRWKNPVAAFTEMEGSSRKKSRETVKATKSAVSSAISSTSMMQALRVSMHSHLKNPKVRVMQNSTTTEKDFLRNFRV